MLVVQLRLLAGARDVVAKGGVAKGGVARTTVQRRLQAEVGRPLTAVGEQHDLLHDLIEVTVDLVVNWPVVVVNSPALKAELV